MYRSDTVFRAAVEIAASPSRPCERATFETSSFRAFRMVLRALRRAGVRVRFTERITRKEMIELLTPRRRETRPAQYQIDA